MKIKKKRTGEPGRVDVGVDEKCSDTDKGESWPTVD
jgi:hypothetical protein